MAGSKLAVEELLQILTVAENIRAGKPVAALPSLEHLIDVTVQALLDQIEPPEPKEAKEAKDAEPAKAASSRR